MNLNFSIVFIVFLNQNKTQLLLTVYVLSGLKTIPARKPREKPPER